MKIVIKVVTNCFVVYVFFEIQFYELPLVRVTEPASGCDIKTKNDTVLWKI